MLNDTFHHHGTFPIGKSTFIFDAYMSRCVKTSAESTYEQLEIEGGLDFMKPGSFQKFKLQALNKFFYTTHVLPIRRSNFISEMTDLKKYKINNALNKILIR